MKKILSILVASVLLCVSTAGTAAAGTRVRFPWEGAAIALGTIGFLAALSQVDARADGGVAAGVPYAPDPGPSWGPGYRPYDRDGRPYDRGDRYDRHDGDLYDRRDRYDRHDCRDRYERHGRVWVPGYWVTVRVWVPGGWQHVWEPEFRDGRGRWSPGRYIQRQDPGRYEARRVWRDGYYR